MTAGLTWLERARSWWPILPLLLLLAGTYWLNAQVNPKFVRAERENVHDIDFEVQGLSAVTLDQRGRARYYMVTERLWHYGDDDSTYLTRPRMVSLSSPNQPMVTWAETGKLTARAEDVYLYNEIKVMRMNMLDGHFSQLSTAYLHLMPDQDRAETDEPLVLEMPQQTITAKGMWLDNAQRRVVLMNKVRASYDPAR